MFFSLILGCTSHDGNFYFGGQSWSLPDCGRGVCAKTLRGGWEITVERLFVLLYRPVVDVIKLFLEEIKISQKLRNGIKFVLMSDLAQQLIFYLNLTLKVFIAVKMDYSCCFS